MKHHIENPYRRAILTLSGIAGFSLLATLAIWGGTYLDLIDPALIWIGTIFSLFFSLIVVVIWILGIRQVQRSRNFLDSERPFVRWTYSPAEWEQLKKSQWQDEKGDWKVQFGCLTVLFAIVGSLTGVLLGWNGGLIEIIVSGTIGFGFGGLSGLILGFLVAGGNYLGARQSYHQSSPGQVALGADEIYASNDYFRGDGRISYIQEANLKHGNPTMLELLIVFPPRPRMDPEENWSIPVPAKWVDLVEEVLPRLAPHHNIHNQE